MSRWLGTTLFICITACTPYARADEILFSNLAPGLAFDSDPFGGWTINGFFDVHTGQQAVAEQFTPSKTAVFTSARVPLTQFAGPSGLSVFLFEDHRGLPGVVLESLDVGDVSAEPSLYILVSADGPTLQAEQSYWLGVIASEPGVLAGWNWNSIGDVSDGTNHVSTQGGAPTGPWFLIEGERRSAFEVRGSVVPEPSSVLLLTAGLATMAILRRRNQAAATLRGGSGRMLHRSE
jgi:hypothetical protein